MPVCARMKLMSIKHAAMCQSELFVLLWQYVAIIYTPWNNHGSGWRGCLEYHFPPSTSMIIYDNLRGVAASVFHLAWLDLQTKGASCCAAKLLSICKTSFVGSVDATKHTKTTKNAVVHQEPDRTWTLQPFAANQCPATSETGTKQNMS